MRTPSKYILIVDPIPESWHISTTPDDHEEHTYNTDTYDTYYDACTNHNNNTWNELRITNYNAEKRHITAQSAARWAAHACSNQAVCILCLSPTWRWLRCIHRELGVWFRRGPRRRQCVSWRRLASLMMMMIIIVIKMTSKGQGRPCWVFVFWVGHDWNKWIVLRIIWYLRVDSKF